jgi:LPXTG-motif cell wall-anchored protein
MFHISTRSLGRTVAAVALVGLGLVAAPANATGGGGDPAPCEPKDAWTETVVITPAVPAVPATPAVPAVTEERMTAPGQPYVAPTEGTPDLWWNWSPNHAQGPQDYVPAFPNDARGTWQGPHENGGPMQDTYGTFQTGGGNSPFFHREEGTEGDPGQPYVAPTYETVVVTPAVPAVPGTPAIPAVTEEVVHPAVTCPPSDEFADYEVCVLWSVDNPGVSDWPQTRVDSDDCTTPPATCEGDQRFQQDYYWIRDAEDEQYLAGLQHLNSPTDDASLEPHNYSMIDVPAASGADCEQPTVAKPEASGTVDCSGYTITLGNADGTAPAAFTVTTPSGDTETHTVAAGDTEELTYPVIEDTATRVEVVADGLEDFHLTYVADCVPPVEAAAPTAAGLVDCNGFVVVLGNVDGTGPATFTVTTPTGDTETHTVPAGDTEDVTYPVIEDTTSNVLVTADGLEDLELSYTADCVLIPEEPVLPPNTPEKPTKPTKPAAAPPTTLLTQAPVQPAPPVQTAGPAQPAQPVLPATGASAPLWLVLVGAGLVLGGVVLTRRSAA